MIVGIFDLWNESNLGASVAYGLVVLAAYKWWNIAKGHRFGPLSKWSFLVLGWLILFSVIPGVAKAALRIRQYSPGGLAEKSSGSRRRPEDRNPL
jgi:predicted membrane channel-forming protein YqfA (hemolysin III family)